MQHHYFSLQSASVYMPVWNCFVCLTVCIFLMHIHVKCIFWFFIINSLFLISLQNPPFRAAACHIFWMVIFRNFLYLLHLNYTCIDIDDFSFNLTSCVCLSLFLQICRYFYCVLYSTLYMSLEVCLLFITLSISITTFVRNGMQPHFDAKLILHMFHLKTNHVASLSPSLTQSHKQEDPVWESRAPGQG